MSRTEPRSIAAILTAVGGASVLCSMPLFLTGVLAAQLRADLGFSVGGLGTAIAVFRGAQACAVYPLGRVVDRIGATRSLRIAVVVSSLSLASVPLASSWIGLLAGMAAGGVGKAIVQPAANRMVANGVSVRHLGFAIGVKQSAPPVATAFSALLLPLVAVAYGWRVTYLVVSSVALVVMLAIGRRRSAHGGAAPTRERTATSTASRPLVLIAVGMCLGSAANTVVATFWVDSAVASGQPAARAGTVLAIASVVAIGSRVSSGIVCDRISRGHLWICATMLWLGGVGMVALTSSAPGVAGAGLVIALAGVWGYPAALWFAVLDLYRGAPGRITGALSVWSLVGATAGPALFGHLVDAIGYERGWAVGAVTAVLAGAAMATAAARLHRTGR